VNGKRFATPLVIPLALAVAAVGFIER